MEEEKELKIDIKSVDIKQTAKSTLEFIKRYQMIFLIIIPMFFAIFFRMYPAYLPITDDWATQSVYGSIQTNIRASISQQYPNLPAANMDKVVQDEFNKYLSDKNIKAQIDEQIKQTSLFFKSKMTDDTGQLYLSDIDTWFWYGEVKNYLKEN